MAPGIFLWLSDVEGEVGRFIAGCVVGAPLLDGPLAVGFTVSYPLVETNHRDSSALSRGVSGLLHLLPYDFQCDSLFAKKVSGEAFFLAEHAEEYMIRAEVLVVQPFCFFSAVGEHPRALMTQRQIYGGGHLRANWRVLLDLRPNGLDGVVQLQ